jgi:hypothetical protein
MKLRTTSLGRPPHRLLDGDVRTADFEFDLCFTDKRNSVLGRVMAHN